MAFFRFRLNNIDFYQATPTELDPVLRRGSAPSQRLHGPPVPVIRAFGATETGQKVCAHIHGALPYLYIEYDGSLESGPVATYIHSLRASIDHALAASYHRNPYDGKSLFVGHIALVKGVPFYGYHVGYRYFLKIYLLNPAYMTRFADLLHQGAILNRVFQPYEGHLQYLAQWMCDYNLNGCAYMDCAKVLFRSPVPEYEELLNSAHKWHDRSIPETLIADSDQYPRQSHCAIEVDVCVQDILNRKEVRPRPIHHDFRERFSHHNPDEKFVPSLAGLWKDETRRRKLRMGLSDPSSSPFAPEALVSMSADPRNSDKGGWIHEEEYGELLQDLVREERQNGPRPRFETFVNEKEGGSQVKTAIESIEDLYPGNLNADAPDEGATESTGFGFEQIPPSGQDLTTSGQQPTHEEEKEMLQELEGDALEDEVDEVATGEESSLGPLSLAEATRCNSGDVTSVDGAGKTTSGSDSDVKTLKRKFDAPEESVSKRQRVLKRTDAIRVPRSKRVSFFGDQSDGGSTDAITPTQPNHNIGLGPSSQGSIKAHSATGATTQAFPVVKNPAAADSVLRLSQSGYSNSQEPPKTPGMKGAACALDTSPKAPWSNSKPSPIIASAVGLREYSQIQYFAKQLEQLGEPSTGKTLIYAHPPPPRDFVESTMIEAGRPPVIYQEAYYSNEKDVPERPREYAGREFRLESTTLPYLPAFDPTGTSAASRGMKASIVVNKRKETITQELRKQGCGLQVWEIATPPPSRNEVEKWLAVNPKPNGDEHKKRPPTFLQRSLSQIDGPTQKPHTQRSHSSSVKHETQYMSIMSVEVHANSRGKLFPDPAEDEIGCIFWAIQGETDVESSEPRLGILCLSDQNGIASRIAKATSAETEFEDDELELINRLVSIVREVDPDILTGYEVHNGSWGYLIERARLKYEYNLCDEISRVKTQAHGRFGKDADRWGFEKASTIRVTGRHMINIWRAMTQEAPGLLQYSMEHVVWHILHKRVPHYSYEDLTSWYKNGVAKDLSKVLSYFLSRVQLNLEILEVNETIARTSEQARLLGVDFFSVISRGSQFKVESTMFRIAKPENFILVSPSRSQVGQQNALECLPLVMEPQSAFYTSPVLVLDFQSLYPSVMIAYNYCYSTCLGRIVSWRGRNKMGFMDFKREPQLLGLVKDHINIAPNGMMYVKPELRKSLLAKMLGEILETRVMVKIGMKQDKDDKALQQLLNNRQLALKLLANVTYGYTSASFSGRMPCSEIADSIVQTGRETLEKAITLIHSVERWGAEVVYGDTDSLFIHLPGRTKDQAFTIGEEIVEAVSKSNPRPIKLKFEKVYHPCVLLAKKRYVGFKYEHRNQETPDFDAKGIETIRRDGTPAVQKIEECALKTLFRTADLSQVKSYFQAQCRKIMEGRISIQDFLFAKEVKLGTYSDRGPPPPGALVAAKRMLEDPRAEPQYGERVPYVVIAGAPGARLFERCVAPEVLLKSDSFEIDAEYYICKNIIPPLERIFNLVGANVRGWYDEMPKVQRIRNISVPLQNNGNPTRRAGMTLESYMQSSACLLCRAKLPARRPGINNRHSVLLCPACLKRPARSLLQLYHGIQEAETKVRDLDDICRSCARLSLGDEVKCDNSDCPVYYSRVKAGTKLKHVKDRFGGVVEALHQKEGRRLEW